MRPTALEKLIRAQRRAALGTLVRTEQAIPVRPLPRGELLARPGSPAASRAESAQLLSLAATGATIPAGGGPVTFDEIIARHGFAATGAAGTTWVHPVDAVYALTYEHAWTSFLGGGVIRLEVGGVLVPEGVLADGTSGQTGSGTLLYRAAAGTTGRIWIEAATASDQLFDGFLSVGVTDPATLTTGSVWTKVFDGDVYDLHWDGANWWTTAGTSTVTKRDVAFAPVTSFPSSMSLARGVARLGDDVWISGGASGEEHLTRHDLGGTIEATIVTGPSSDGNVGLAADGSDLWLMVEVGGTATQPSYLERWSAAGALISSIELTSGADGGDYGSAAYFAGAVYVVDRANDQLVAVQPDGTVVATIDISGAATQATGVWIDGDGTLYVSKEGDGVYRREAKIGDL